jgi:transmembrane sensor
MIHRRGGGRRLVRQPDMALFGRHLYGTRAGGDDPAAAEAAMWLARHQLGTLDAAEFEQWRERSPANAIAFARALATWERFDGETTARPATPHRVTRRELLRAAGVVLAVGVAGGGVFTGRAYAWSSATTAVGESRTLRLPDGSTAALNTDSRLSWRFSATERSLWIERGEIGLQLGAGPQPVLHGERRGVLLSAGRFNARLRNDAIDLLVLEGEARIEQRVVKASPDPLNGSAAPSLLVSRDAAIVRSAAPEQVAGTLAWQRGEILFQDATLGTAVEEYNRFLTRKIVIVDRELASIPVGGRFTSTDPREFLEAISAGLDVHVSRSDRAYLLTR